MSQTDLRFSEASFTELFKGGFLDHIQAHYDALNDHAFPLKPDWERYFALESMRMLRCYAARDAAAGDKLVGYAIFLVHSNLHYSTSIWAFEDLYWLSPEYRTGMTGYKWMKYFLTEIEKVADKVVMGTKTKLETGVLLKRLGYKHFENLYSKVTERGRAQNRDIG